MSPAPEATGRERRCGRAASFPVPARNPRAAEPLVSAVVVLPGIGTARPRQGGNTRDRLHGGAGRRGAGSGRRRTGAAGPWHGSRSARGHPSRARIRSAGDRRANRCDGRDVRPDPPRAPRGRERGRRALRARRGRLRAHRPALAEERPAGEPGRGPLPDDGHRHGLQPAVLGQPGGHRPGRTHLHDRHAGRPACPAPGRRAVLHHRCRRPRPDHDVARRRPVLRPGPLHRRDPARLHARRLRPARRPRQPGGDPRTGHQLQRLPRPRRPAGCRSGTSCPTASSSTSRSVVSTARVCAAGRPRRSAAARTRPSAAARATGDHPTYDRPPATSGPAPDTDTPSDLQEVPR